MAVTDSAPASNLISACCSKTVANRYTCSKTMRSVWLHQVEYVVSSGVLDKFNLVHTETLVSHDVMELRELRQSLDKHVQAGTFEVRDITATYQAGMTSYLVGPGREHLLAALERHAVMCALPIRPVHPPRGPGGSLEGRLRLPLRDQL